MKKPVCLATIFCVSAAFALKATAGSEEVSSGKEMKQVAQTATPSLCDWTGFYSGIHGGGQFGHSETEDLLTTRRFGYEESGFNGGIQFGYNYQWRWLVLGPEFDVGFMNLEGGGDERGFTGVRGQTDSDFYSTMRGRIGVHLDCWLFYATGGAIGLNYTSRFHVDPNFFDARESDFDWGYTLGGGVERMLTPHWSVKAEYLYYALDDLSFGNTGSGVTANFNAHSFGHIVRAGLNYKF